MRLIKTNGMTVIVNKKYSTRIQYSIRFSRLIYAIKGTKDYNFYRLLKEPAESTGHNNDITEFYNFGNYTDNDFYFINITMDEYQSVQFEKEVLPRVAQEVHKALYG